MRVAVLSIGRRQVDVHARDALRIEDESEKRGRLTSNG